MPRYLSKFTSTMPASQRAQVSVLLTEGKEDGAITNFEEFKTALEAYSDTLDTEAKPLFQVVRSLPAGIVSSWVFNYMVRTMRLDVETVFSEVDNIYEKVDVYRRLSDGFVQDTRDALAALDTAISRQEILNASPDYALAQYNTFNMLGVGRLYRDADEAGSLFYDYRRAETLDSSFDAVVDAQREGLVLPISNENVAEITSVLVDTEATTASQLDVNPADNDIGNLIEPDDGKYWVHGVLLMSEDEFGNQSTPPSAGVTIRLVVELSGYQDINTLNLVPFTDNSITISQISYEDVDGNEYAITTLPVTISEQSVISFSRVRAKSVILDIQQKSYAELSDFTYSSQPADIQEIEDLMAATNLSQTVEIGSGLGAEYAKGYFYAAGFDYIQASLCDYGERGVYVTTPLVSTGRVSEVLLDATYEKSTDQSGNVGDAVEFTIAKYDYDESDGLLKLSLIPVIGSDSDTTQEELVINTDTGVLRFYPTHSSILVYRDHTLLTIGADYDLSNDGLNFYATIAGLDASTPSGPPYSVYVKLTNPQSSSVYTATYTPASTLATADGIHYLTSDGSAVLNGNVVEFTYPPTQDVSYSRIFLIILMRTLTYSNRETPIIQEYSLYASEK
jgi:hypothetical protein